MKILVDGRVLGRRQITGVERYATQLIKALEQQGLSLEVETPRSLNRYARHVWEHVHLPLKARGYDILFCPANLSPLWKPGSCKYVVTVHDLSFKIIKNAYSASYRRYYELMTRRVMRLADRIVTDSDYEKNVICGFFPEHRHKVTVIYPGIGESFKPLEEAGKKDDYVLYVGTLNPRKNIKGIIEAFLMIKDKIPHKLVIAGAKQDIYRECGAAAHERITYLGSVDDTTLITLYQNAALLVFPSFYEGFGLPVLEAMGCGCPVVTSNVTSLPEIAGDAAIAVDPANSEQIAEAALKVLTDAPLRRALIQKGLERVRLFSWDRTARELINVMRETSGKS